MTSTLSHISLICIPMTDQDAALAFYTDHLGMELRVNEPFADGAMRWIEVAPPGAQTTIALAPPPQGVRPVACRRASSSRRATWTPSMRACATPAWMWTLR